MMCQPLKRRKIDPMTWVRPILLVVASCLGQNSVALAQEVEIWEFSPYKTKLWFHFDADVPVSTAAQARLMAEVSAAAERQFRATWLVQSTLVPRNLERHISRRLPDLVPNEISRNELVLVVSTTHEATKNVRAYDTAADSVESVEVSPESYKLLNASASAEDLDPESPTARLIHHLKENPLGDAEIIDGLKTEACHAAFLPRHKAKEISKTRTIHTLLPWQSELFMSQNDKIFFINIGFESGEFSATVRELDCPMVHLGPHFSSGTSDWQHLPNIVADLIKVAFAPAARVENAGSTWAELRHKAGGLIVDELNEGDQNPARIQVGDILQPFVRREDRNSVPILLQAMSFTYCTVTESDGVNMRANVYTYSGGPGLQGKQNRRTQRILLRVRPIAGQSDVRVAVRGNAKRSQSGCYIYTKDLISEEFTFLGRSDWRGRITVPTPTEPTNVLPDRIRAKRFDVLNQARRDAIAKQAADYEAALKKAEEAGDPPPKPPSEAPVVQQAPIDPETLIKLNYPMVMLYVKSGDTLLAKLPFVPGLKEIETAELMDDSLRLYCEALVRGFHNQVLDLIGKRNLYSARIKSLLKDKKLDEADKLVKELQLLENFNVMNDALSEMERKVLEQTMINKPPRAGQIQIDRMFKTTRDMLQKYLQDETVSDLADQVRRARAGS